MAHPRLRQTVLDTTDPRALAEFYRELLGWSYRAGDEPPLAGSDDPLGHDWLVLHNASGGPGLAFQQAESLPRVTWQRPEVPQQLHLDLTVASFAELVGERDRALALGASLLHDRSDDAEEALYVFADPAGHPFCIFVGGELPDA